ncbi:MAG: AAA family ATPase [Muribaculaceae bacterium]|nr:AAA family ATPase [Muribaculaceae bacterium]
MTVKLAVTGKSGSGKTTLVKALLEIFKEMFPEKSILLFDNDLSSELGHTFGLDIRNTIYGIRSGKHEYKTGIPEDMTKQEYIEWAMEDILVQIDENVDIIVSWLVGSKDCRCPVTKLINDAVNKLINTYDIVIFDCEFDLKYLNQLVDTEIDSTIIVANPSEESAHLAKRIEEFSAKYAAGNQLGVVINKVQNNDLSSVYELLRKHNLDIIGTIPYDKELEKNAISRDSKCVQNAIKEFYFRLNLPQIKQ